MNGNQTTSIHLYNLSHCNTVNPLSKLYGLNFDSFIGEKSINVPSQIENKFCNNCGQLSIPGLTTSIRISYKKKRRLEYRCLECKHKTVDESLIQNKPEETTVPKTQQFQALWTNKNTNKVSKEVSKSKERIKKRKQNNLSSLLESKRKEKKEASRMGSLNLMEFMK